MVVTEQNLTSISAERMYLLVQPYSEMKKGTLLKQIRIENALILGPQ